MSLDPIDELYKNSFENYSVPYNEQGWLHMQKVMKPTEPLHLLKTHILKWYILLPSTAVIATVVVVAILTLNNNNSKYISLNNVHKTSNNISVSHAYNEENKINENKSKNYTTTVDKGTLHTKNNINAAKVLQLSEIEHTRNATENADVNKAFSNFNNKQRISSSIVGVAKASNVVELTTINSSNTFENDSILNIDKEKFALASNETSIAAPITANKNVSLYSKTNSANEICDVKQNEIFNKIQTLPFVIDSINAHKRLTQAYKIYKPMPLPGIISRYEMGIRAGAQSAHLNNGYTSSGGNEQMISIDVWHGHFSYGVGIGRNAFNAQKNYAADSNTTSTLKVPTTTTVFWLDTFTFYRFGKKHIDTVYYWHQVHGTKDSTIFNKKSVNKQISNRFIFIEIPVNFGYRFNIQNGFAEIQGGVSFLMNQSLAYNYYYADGSYAHIKPYNAFALLGTLKLGYNLTKHFGAFGYGQYRYASTFNPLPTGDKMIWTSWSAGGGLFYRF